MRIILLLLLFGWLKWIHALDMSFASSKPSDLKSTRDKRQSQYIEYWPTMLTYDTDCSESKNQIMPATSYSDDSCSESDMLGHKPQQPIYNPPLPQTNRNGAFGGVLLNVYDLPATNKQAFENEVYRPQEVSNWQNPATRAQGFGGVAPNSQIMPENVAQLGAPYATTPNEPHILRNSDYNRPPYSGQTPRPHRKKPKQPKNRRIYTAKPYSNKIHDPSLECKDVYLSEEYPKFNAPSIQEERKIENTTYEMISEMLKHLMETIKQHEPQRISVNNDDIMRIPLKETATGKQKNKKKIDESKESRSTNERKNEDSKVSTQERNAQNFRKSISGDLKSNRGSETYEENSASIDGTDTPMLEELHVTNALMNSQRNNARDNMSPRTPKKNKSNNRKKPTFDESVNKNRGSYDRRNYKTFNENVDRNDLHDESLSINRGNDDSIPTWNDSANNAPILEQLEERRKGITDFRDDAIGDLRKRPSVTQMPLYNRKSNVFNDEMNREALDKVYNPKASSTSSQSSSQEVYYGSRERKVPPNRNRTNPKPRPLQQQNQMTPRELNENNFPTSYDNILLGQTHETANTTNRVYPQKSEKSSEQQSNANETKAERKINSESVEDRADQFNQALNSSTETDNDSKLEQITIEKPAALQKPNESVTDNKSNALGNEVRSDFDATDKIASTNNENFGPNVLGDNADLTEAGFPPNEAAAKQPFIEVATQQKDVLPQTVNATLADATNKQDPPTIVVAADTTLKPNDEPESIDTRNYNYFTKPEFKNRPPKLKKPYFEPIAYETKPTKRFYDHEMAAQVRRTYEPQPARPNYVYVSAAERLPARINNHAYDLGPTTIPPYASQLMPEEKEQPLLAAPQPIQSVDPIEQPKSFYLNKIVKAAEQKVLTHATPQRIKDLQPFDGFRAYDACNNAQRQKPAADNLLGGPHRGTVGSPHEGSISNPKGGTVNNPYNVPIGSPYAVPVANPHVGSNVGDPSPVARVTSGKSYGDMPVTAFGHQSTNVGGNPATGVVNTAMSKVRDNGYGKAYQSVSCDSSEDTESTEYMNYQRPGPAPQFNAAKYFT